MMTDKEMAVNWIRSQGWNEETLPSDEFGQMFLAFLAGLKAGEEKVDEIKAQVENMKCCQNCLHLCGLCELGIDGCYVCSKWELRRRTIDK